MEKFSIDRHFVSKIGTSRSKPNRIAKFKEFSTSGQPDGGVLGLYGYNDLTWSFTVFQASKHTLKNRSSKVLGSKAV